MAAALTGLLVLSLTVAENDALVVYCAHDSIHADAVLQRFERETGVRVQVRYDTEATKSLGLVELLRRERDHPRCDVFWNNEVLGTMQLQDEGLLVPYRGPGFERIPARYREPEGHWVGFAARLRVWIVHNGALAATQAAVDAALRKSLAAGDLSRVAIAKPLYGTTRTHYTVLWERWGPEELAAWHGRWRAAGVREVPGNSVVKNLVAAGSCDLGLTDTDDFYVARDAGEPVAMVPVQVEGAAVCIPNTVAIIAGTQRLDGARRLVDFLLSEETELELARSRARQVPLGPVRAAAVPPEVRDLLPWAEGAHDLTRLGDASRACVAWLRSEYLR